MLLNFYRDVFFQLEMDTGASFSGLLSEIWIEMFNL